MKLRTSLFTRPFKDCHNDREIILHHQLKLVKTQRRNIAVNVLLN